MAKVLVVDKSILIKTVIRKIFESHKLIEAIHEANDGIEALEILRKTDIDLIILDLDTPKLVGLEFFQEIPRIIMVSSYTSDNAVRLMKALEIGAFDFILKPDTYSDFHLVKDDIIRKVEAAISKRQFLSKKREIIENALKHRPEVIEKPKIRKKLEEKAVISIGISTGGPQTLGEILPKLPKDYPYPILVAIHMPDAFTKDFANRLDEKCKLHVKEAEEGEILKPGTVYISRGRTNMVITGDINKPKVEYKQDKSLIYIPSANLLFSSSAQVFEQNTCAIVMTGMGDDGSKGIIDVKKLGGITVAEDPKSAVLWAMPENAIKTGTIDHVLKKEEIPDFLVNIANS